MVRNEPSVDCSRATKSGKTSQFVCLREVNVADWRQHNENGRIWLFCYGRPKSRSAIGREIRGECSGYVLGCASLIATMGSALECSWRRCFSSEDSDIWGLLLELLDRCDRSDFAPKLKPRDCLPGGTAGWEVAILFITPSTLAPDNQQLEQVFAGRCLSYGARCGAQARSGVETAKECMMIARDDSRAFWSVVSECSQEAANETKQRRQRGGLLF